MAKIDYENEPTKYSLHRFIKLGITLCLWISIFILCMIPIVSHIVTEDKINWEFVKFVGFGAGFALVFVLLTGTLCLVYSRQDKPVRKRLNSQRCHAVCPKCTESFDYLGSGVHLRPGYDCGAAQCPKCGHWVEHSTKNIVEILEDK